MSTSACLNKAFGLAFFCLLFCSAAMFYPTQEALAQKDCIPVQIAKVESADLVKSIEGIGTLEAWQEVTLRPELAGIIEQVLFKEGEAIKKGQVLFYLEDDMYQARLRAQQAALKQAKAELSNQRQIYERRKRLFAKDQISEEIKDEAETKFETTRAKVERIQAEVEQIQETLEDTKILAPFDGYMGELKVDPGNWVDVGTALSTMTQSTRLHIAFTLPERYMGEVKKGQLAKVYVPAYPDRFFKARVNFISPQIETSSRTFLVKAELKNPEGKLKPGGFASVKLEVGQRKDVPIIPEEALIPTRTGYMVFVLQNKKAQAREVEIGLRRPGEVEVVKGLKIGQKIIRSGHINVHQGELVCEKNQNKEVR